MDTSKTTIVVGPPGTGKTTDLLTRVERLLASGIRPDRIGFVSFTKKASEEGLHRATQRFNLESHDLPHFRTLHSMAFRGLGLSRSRMLHWTHLRELGKMLGLDFRGYKSEEGEWEGMGTADRIMFLENLSRVTLTPLRQVWEAAGDFDIDFRDLDRFARGLQSFKTGRGLLDFTDIIEQCVMKNAVPEVDYLFVDEVQDLSPLQWLMVERLAMTAKETVVAGDDLQGIYGWSGADVDKFVNLNGAVVVLDRSYRVPSSVHKVAESIERRIVKKRTREWHSRKEVGKLEYSQSIEDVDLSKGTWLLLVRNNYQIALMEDECMRQGVSFDSPNRAPLKTPAFSAIRSWEAMRRGSDVEVSSAAECGSMMADGMMNVKKLKQTTGFVSMATLVRDFGLKTTSLWRDSLTKIPPELRDYFVAARRRGEKLLGPPRVKVSTIHAAKGGEADHVAVVTDMSQRCFNNMESDPDSESRVYYVAVTRCRESLTLIQPRTAMFYEI